ncbi:MAG: hypothetical protein ACYC9L_15270 [Sulfuricaulis sp.]
MKKSLIVLLALLFTAPAYADRDWGWRGDWIAPAMMGGIIAYDLAYPYPYPAYQYPSVVYTQPYPVYVQTAPAPAPQQFWYYCASAKGYYPYVQSCSEAWQPVPTKPTQ